MFVMSKVTNLRCWSDRFKQIKREQVFWCKTLVVWLYFISDYPAVISLTAGARCTLMPWALSSCPARSWENFPVTLETSVASPSLINSPFVIFAGKGRRWDQKERFESLLCSDQLHRCSTEQNRKTCSCCTTRWLQPYLHPLALFELCTYVQEGAGSHFKEIYWLLLREKNRILVCCFKGKWISFKTIG